MKNLLFPTFFRPIGWILLVLGIVAAVLYYLSAFSFTWGSLEETVFNDTLFIGVMLGALFIACAKEPHEDEMTRAIRLASLLNALYAYVILFIASVIFINGVEFLEFVLLCVFLLPILFAFIFRAKMYMYYKENADEE